MHSSLKQFKNIGAKAIQNPPNPLYRASAHTDYRFSPTAHRFLADRYCVRHEMTREVVDSKPRQGLWWSVVGQHMPLKAAMRSWCKKRMTKAILKALCKHGFDACGMPLPAKEGASYPQRTRGPQGTLVVYCQVSVLTASAEEVRMAGELVVQQAMRRAGLEWEE